MKQLYAHSDGTTLEEHLYNTALTAQKLAQEKHISLFTKELFVQLATLLGATHDIGKATSYFQDYLTADRKKKSPLQHHSLFSAIWTYYLAKQITDDSLLPFLCFVVVKRHHNDLMDIKTETSLDETETLKKQFAALYKEELKAIFQSLSKRLNAPFLKLDPKEFPRYLEDIHSELSTIRRRYLRRLKNGDDLHLYLKLALLYSILLDADKTATVLKDKSIVKERRDISGKIVLKYKESAFKNAPQTFINNLRDLAFKEVGSCPINLGEKFYCLNLPTGLGKTLIGLHFALKLRENIAQSGYTPRIIYVLPFLSIIDQNYEIYQQVLNTKYKIDSHYLLKHHHLTDIVFYEKDREFDFDAAKILLEGWNAEIIVTTFIQFFHTLIGYKNRMLRKFHKLAGAIIILDEVQAIPHKYWLVVKEILTSLATQLNTYILLCTATQPLIFPKGALRDTCEKEKYFRQLDRITIHPHLTKKQTLEEFINEFSFEKKTLFIVNTINAAKTLFRLLQGRYPQEKIAYLTTHIIPKERLKRIKEIKQDKYKLCVSTQLVEAGVDIDFPVVYRDLAPLDALIQSAGRCNRNAEEKGTMYVLNLINEKGKRYAYQVYDLWLIDKTEKILVRYSSISEPDILELINSYYEEVNQEKPDETAKALLKSLQTMHFNGEKETYPVSNFRLIEEDYPKWEVFIEYDEEAKMLWKEFTQIRKIKDRFERKMAYEQIKSRFSQYIISVPQTIENRPPVVENLLYVPYEQLEDFYDKETGYKLEGGVMVF